MCSGTQVGRHESSYWDFMLHYWVFDRHSFWFKTLNIDINSIVNTSENSPATQPMNIKTVLDNRVPCLLFLYFIN